MKFKFFLTAWPFNWFYSSSLNFGSLQSHDAFQAEFLQDPFVGTQRSKYLQLTRKECDFCFWMIHYRNQRHQTRISLAHPISTRTDKSLKSSVEINLTCMTKSQKSQCSSVINAIKVNFIKFYISGQLTTFHILAAISS